MSISVDQVRKTFGSFVALDDVSLTLPTGELIALLGPSGCGKTTLLRIIAGLETADAGRISLAGEDASSTHVRDRHVGFVFQHYALFRHMTVFENVAFGLRVKPRSERPGEAQIRDRVMTLLKLVQLDWTAGRFPSQLSGGQRQRIALARALAVEPRVLLLDEPFGALDAKVRKELRRWLRRLHEELHITSIFVTHDQEEALEVADRIVLMNQGRIEQIGTAREVYDHPETAFAFTFLGAANRFDGRIRGGRFDVGRASFPIADERLVEGAAARGFVRPHEIDIDPTAASGIEGTVARVLEFGPNARVEVVPTDGGGDVQQIYEVEISRSASAGLAIAAGQRVGLVPRRLRVFGA